MDFKNRLNTLRNGLGSLLTNNAEQISTLPKKPKKSLYNKLRNFLRLYTDWQEALIGVNITPHYIRVCEIKNNDGKWHVNNLASTRIDGNFTMDFIHENPSIYTDNLRYLIEQNNIKAKKVSFSLPLSGSIIKIITLPQMTEDDINRAVAAGSFWENMINPEINFDDYAVSYEIINTNTEEGTIDLLFVASKKSYLKLYTKIIEDAHLKPVIADIRCFAFRNAISLGTNINAGVEPTIFLEIGADENHVLILSNKGIEVYDIPVSDTERNIIIENFSNPEAFAGFLRGYVEQVKEKISVYKSAHYDVELKKIYVTSFLPLGSTFFEHLANILSEYEVSECNLFDYVEVKSSLSGRAKAQENLSAWAVTVGAAMRKIDIFDFYKGIIPSSHINLMPNGSNLKKIEKVRILSQISITAIAIVMLLFVTTSYIAVNIKSSFLIDKLNTLKGIEQQHEQAEKELKHLQQMMATLKSLGQARSEIPSNQITLLTAYRHLNTAIPNGVWLNEVNYIGSDKIEISGNSINDQKILDFVNALNDGAEYKDIALKTMDSVASKDLDPSREVMIKTFTLQGKITGITVQNNTVEKKG